MLLLEKSKLEIKSVKPSKDVGLLECKLVIKFNGKQFTINTSEKKSEKPTLEGVLYSLIEDYEEYFYLLNSKSHYQRYEGLSDKEIQEYYKHCLFVKDGLERIYGKKNLKTLIDYFEIEI